MRSVKDPIMCIRKPIDIILPLGALSKSGHLENRTAQRPGKRLSQVRICPVTFGQSRNPAADFAGTGMPWARAGFCGKHYWHWLTLNSAAVVPKRPANS
jgi:hypothetical protein